MSTAVSSATFAPSRHPYQHDTVSSSCAGADRRGNSGEAVKLEVPERAAKAFNSAKASSSPGNTASGATEQQQRQPAVKQQEEEQPQSEGNNAAGEASGRGGDRDGGNTGGAALDGCGDAAAAANTAEVAAAGDAADVADAAHDAAYSCEEALERLSLKLHGVRPDELAPDVAQRMHKWLESMDAVTLQVRRGKEHAVMVTASCKSVLSKPRILASRCASEGTR